MLGSSLGASGEGQPRVPTVLVVDDEPDILESLLDLLQTALDDVRVLTAPSGRAALDTMRTTAVDLVITDYKMPGMNGLEFLRAARSVAPSVPRILLTAFPDLDIAVRALNEEGIDHFFTKPLDPGQVIHGVREALERARTRVAKGRELAVGLAELRRAAHRPGSSEPTASAAANGR